MSNLYKKTNIKLYHYSTVKYEWLLSRKGQGITDLKDFKGSTARYNDSISFFLEPIPHNLGTILNNEHPFWKPGTVLYEYELDLINIPEDATYRLTEADEVVDLLYNKQDWSLTKDNPALREKFIREIDDLEKKLKLNFVSREEFIKLHKKYKGDISGKYKRMLEFHHKYPEDGLMEKYAATVPHAMIYVGEDKVLYDKVTRIKLT